jgi:hypothetical protein
MTAKNVSCQQCEHGLCRAHIFTTQASTESSAVIVDAEEVDVEYRQQNIKIKEIIKYKRQVQGFSKNWLITYDEVKRDKPPTNIVLNTQQHQVQQTKLNADTEAIHINNANDTVNK